MKVITKATAAIESSGDDESPHGSFEAVLSSPARDRDGDEFRATEWKTPLPEHITIDIDHGMNVASTVGSATPFIGDDGKLHVKGTFASTELGQTVRSLVSEGHIRTMSVAALEDRSKVKAGGAIERELLNGAFCAIPANPEAVVLAAKAATPPAPPSTETDSPTMVQAIHDAATHLGASCAEPANDEDTGNADGANKSIKIRSVSVMTVDGAMHEFDDAAAAREFLESQIDEIVETESEETEEVDDQGDEQPDEENSGAESAGSDDSHESSDSESGESDPSPEDRSDEVPDEQVADPGEEIAALQARALQMRARAFNS